MMFTSQKKYDGNISISQPLRGSINFTSPPDFKKNYRDYQGSPLRDGSGSPHRMESPVDLQRDYRPSYSMSYNPTPIHMSFRDHESSYRDFLLSSNARHESDQNYRRYQMNRHSQDRMVKQMTPNNTGPLRPVSPPNREVRANEITMPKFYIDPVKDEPSFDRRD